MNLLFVAYMSTIMQEDADLLKRAYPVEVIDLFGFATSYTQIGKYFFRFFDTIIPGILRNDLVYVWTVDYSTFPVILLSKLFKKKVIAHISGYEVCADKRNKYGSQLSKVRGAAVRWCLRHADRVLVMSEAYADITKRIEPSANITVVPGGVKEELLRSPLPIKDEQAVLAYRSYTGVEDIKGVHVFREAAQYVPYDCKVICDMNQPDLIELLKKTKVYCQISYTECFGMTVLEAMACGCVPVVTNRGGLPEIVGGAGVVIPYGGIMETAYAIQKAMKMSGDQARERAKQLTSNLRLTRLKAVIDDVLPSSLNQKPL